MRAFGNNLRIALRALRVNKLRSLLTMLGIILGVASVIAMLAVGAGTQARIQEEIRSLGSNIMVLLNGAATSGGVRRGFGSRPLVTELDARAIQAEVPAVLVAAPSVRGNAQTIFANANWNTTVLGVTEEYFVARDWLAVTGRVLAREEVEAGRTLVLLGQTVAERLFPIGQDPVDQVIRINRVPFTVIGVLARKGQSMGGLDQDDVVIMPLRTAQVRVIGRNPANPRAVGSVAIKIRDGVDMAAAAEEIRELMRRRHGVQPGREDTFWLRNLSEVMQAREDASRAMTGLLAAVAAVSLLVGGIGIMNIMLVSVTERTREIGIRLAVGARGRDVLAQFLVEAVTLSVLGGLIGVVLGVAGAQLIGEIGGLRVELAPEPIIISIGSAAAVGVFFGFYPARRAARLPPVDALRYE